MYGKIWCDEDVHDLISVETEFPTIFYNDALTFEVALLYEPAVSPLNNNQIDFRISFDKFEDEDYTTIYNKNSFSCKIIYVDDLKTDSENDNDKVNIPSFLSSEPTINFSPEPTVSPQHIDEFNLKNETSLSECDGIDTTYPEEPSERRRIMEYLVKFSKKASILELKCRHLNITVSNIGIRRIHSRKIRISVPELHKKPRRSSLIAMIATKLIKPTMSDSYTSFMCLESWGQGSFAHALIELDATCGLNDILVVKPKSTTLVSISFSSLEEDHGNYVDDLVDDTRKKVEAPSRKNGIWSDWKVERNIDFSFEIEIHYFERDGLEFVNMDHVVEVAEHGNVPSELG
ncbi:hypothetical protein Tco_1483992 [Tanacetum coccineum]